MTLKGHNALAYGIPIRRYCS